MYESKPIRFLDDTEVEFHAIGLLIKLSVITGWILPDDERMKGILYEQFRKKMREEYNNLNIEEIEYAIRKHGTKIKDWGKAINLSMIDEAVSPYFSKRAHVRQLEESQVVHKHELPPASEPIVDEDEYMETVKTIFIKAQQPGLIPVKIYEILESRNLIELTNEEKQQIRDKVEAKINDEAIRDGLNEMRKLRVLKDNKRDWEIFVRNRCKQEAAAHYFLKENAIDNF